MIHLPELSDNDFHRTPALDAPSRLSMALPRPPVRLAGVIAKDEQSSLGGSLSAPHMECRRRHVSGSNKFSIVPISGSPATGLAPMVGDAAGWHALTRCETLLFHSGHGASAQHIGASAICRHAQSARACLTSVSSSTLPSRHCQLARNREPTITISENVSPPLRLHPPRQIHHLRRHQCKSCDDRRRPGDPAAALEQLVLEVGKLARPPAAAHR